MRTLLSSGLHRLLAVAAVAAIALTPGFYRNHWKTADQGWFDDFQSDSEALVLLGVAQATEGGVLSSRYKLQWPGPWWELPSSWGAEVARAYGEGRRFERYEPYVSQIGLQGFAYSLLRPLLPVDNSSFVRLLYFVNSLLLAVAIGIIAWWLGELGLPVCSLLLLTLSLFAPYLIAIARNLYWVAWTWTLPMLAAIAVTRTREVRPGAIPRWAEFLALSGTVFVKCACGYEYVTSVLVMMTLPYVVPALQPGRPWREVGREWAWICLAGISGFGAAILVHSIQNASLWHIGAGLQTILDTAARRTGGIGQASSMAKVFADSLRVPLSDVFSAYLGQVVFQVPGLPSFRVSPLAETLLPAWAALGLAALGARAPRATLLRATALGVMATLSMVGPLSWVVLAKGHSVIHQHINPVLWALPFPMLAVAFVATATALLLRWRIDRAGVALASSAAAILLILAQTSLREDLRLAAKSLAQGRSAQVLRGAEVAPAVLSSEHLLTLLVRHPERFDWTAPVTVRAFPRNADALPLDHRAAGYESVEFLPSTRREPLAPWSLFSRSVVVRQSLPGYDIAKLVVSQTPSLPDSAAWEVEVRF